MLTKRSPVQCLAVVVVSLSKELYPHCSSPPSYVNGDLAIAGEANSKLYMSHLMVEGSGGTLGAHTIILEACTVLLQALVPSSGGFVLHSAWLGRHDRVNGSYKLFYLCVCIYTVYLCCCVVYIMYSYLHKNTVIS